MVGALLFIVFSVLMAWMIWLRFREGESGAPGLSFKRDANPVGFWTFQVLYIACALAMLWLGITDAIGSRG